MNPAKTIEVDGVAHKECSACNEFKPPKDFYKSKNGLLGRQHTCIQCAKRRRLEKLGRDTLLNNMTFFRDGIPMKVCRTCENAKHIKKFLTSSGKKIATCKTCLYYKKAKAVERNGVICKLCRDCRTHLPLDCFSVNIPKRGYFGRNGACKGCMRVRFKGYREANPEIILERSRRWRELYPEKMKESKRRWNKRNPEKSRAQGQRRRARIRKLENTLTNQEWRLTCEIFDNKCALTGSDDISMDHFIPVSTGAGGTHSGNVYPLSNTLNNSKNNKNPFEWFEYAKDKFDLDADKFERVVGVLAAMNCMRVEEFREYVNSAFEEDN